MLSRSANDTWDPAEEGEEDVQHERAGAAAPLQRHGNGRQEEAKDQLYNIHACQSHL